MFMMHDWHHRLLIDSKHMAFTALEAESKPKKNLSAMERSSTQSRGRKGKPKKW